MRSNGKIVLWPVYFDAASTWDGGRRVPKVLAMRAPRTEDLVKAAVEAGFKAELQPGAAHPSKPWFKTGYVLVDAKGPKAKVIRLVAEKLPRG